MWPTCICWLTTGVCVGIYYEGIYMVKVILTEIRHFECPNEKVEENGMVTKCSNLSKESLGWPNTQIYKYTNTQIHIYTNTVFAKKCWYFTRKRSQICWGFDPYGGPSKKNCTTISRGSRGKFWPMTLADTRSEHPEKVVFLNEKGWKSGARPLSRKSHLKSSKKREIWRQRN